MTEPSPWTLDRAGHHEGVVTMVDGTTFMVAGGSGGIVDRTSHGLFALDTRVLSKWDVTVTGRAIEHLTFVPNGPFSGTFVSRIDSPGRDEPALVLVQQRHVGRGMREDIEIRNHGEPCELEISVSVDSDFAALFDVKAGHVLDGALAESLVEPLDDGLELRPEHVDRHATVTAVTVRATNPPHRVSARRATLKWRVALGRSETWSTCLEVGFRHGEHEIELAHPCGRPVEEAIPVNRLRLWRDGVAKVTSGSVALDDIVRQSIEDLGALRIFDPNHVDRVVVAAGAPWFMALFGRDSLLTSWMALPFDTALARGVLAELADAQGARENAVTEEAPGRILHEVRFDRLSAQLLGGERAYYGTVDATPLFVMLVAELARWTGITDGIRHLMPAVDRALGWIDVFGDRDGDGFVEYERAGGHGLENQGWKDSWDGIRGADGEVITAPIALCEVQGYVYAAYRGRAALAAALGEPATEVRRWDERAETLRRGFEDSFWLDDLQAYAVGLDAHKRPIRSVTSNMGHLLWTGIVSGERAERIAGHLVSPSMFSGWGVRTLSADNPGFNPLSYHCGSVWPHDTAIAVAGLARYGFDSEAQMLTSALVDTAIATDGRLPELFGGFDRTDIARPVPYPTACSPQAWSAATPLLLVRSMLGLEPDVPNGVLHVRPRLPPWIHELTMSDVQIGGRPIAITAQRDEAVVSVGPPDIRVVVS